MKIIFKKDFYSKSRMNLEVYVRILATFLLPFVEYKYLYEDFQFLQDNAPHHKSKMTKNWFKENSIKLVPFPP